MALSQRLEFRQSHALIMTPQLMQAIKLLQLSNLDLSTYVEGELERNPLLERTADGEGDAKSDDREPIPEAEASAVDWGEKGVDIVSHAGVDRAGADLNDVPPADTDAIASRSNAESRPAIRMGRSQRWPARRRRLQPRGLRPGRDHAGGPFGGATRTGGPNPARRMIGQYLIDLVDEAGYLTGDLGQVCEKLGTPQSEVEAVLAILQNFDPVGVCARNLTECLSIQLRERDRFDPAMQALVAHLDLLARRDLAALRKICGVGDEDLTDMIAEIRQLNPKPGLAFGSTVVQPICRTCSCGRVLMALG